ncbi:hypothetical protein E4U17_004817 [Claviceps sp. LM77 group G4]|nr:hypothetical protein E4U17_004817 [Claviceps sp. LM77 group G4]KAG6067571.1 hypothetical protein E4U33_005253 [Claviceps sp. LM78 group G4]KAG6072761.1 hypothetical protein E4U16_005119 [Claviceps sp. LM84 group G4]
MGSHQPSSASATASTRRRKQRPHLASAVSRLSLSRTERYSQFRADSSSCVFKDEFPIFAHTGDVEITIQGAIVADGVPTVSNTYLLHQDTLARYSGFFAASTSSQWSKAQSHPTSGNERARDICDDGDGGGGDKDDGGSAQNAFGSTRPKRQWKFELDHAPVYLDAPMLVQTDPFPAQQEESGQAGDSQSSSLSLSGPGSGGPTASHTILSSLQPEDGPPATLNGSQRFYNAHPDMRDMVLMGDKILLRNYDNLFRIFYNCRPMLDNTDAFSAFIECDVMLRLADQYDALAAVRPCVEHHLLQFQSRLWRQIARCSRRFLEFGYLARSKVIFKEALIHQVGLWYLCIPERLNADVPDFVLDIAEDKVYELQEKVSRVEGQLFRLSLTTEKGERVRPADDYLDWLVVSLFRQWLADKTKPRIWPACNNNDSESDNSHHSNEDNVLIPPINIYYVYGKLGSESPSAFLDHNDCEAFLALNPRLHTPENLVRFENRMADLKALARDLVRPLLHNSLELDVSSSDLSETTMDKPFYFTCTTIEDDDIPWPLDLYIPLE